MSLKPPSVISSEQLPMFLIERGKEHFLSLTRSHLPRNMGDKYAEIVETCLTCLDKDNVDFGDEKEFEDEHGIRVGARYIEKAGIGQSLQFRCLLTYPRFSFVSTSCLCSLATKNSDLITTYYEGPSI